jgi:crotonobetainyl-CoA:carnitine CoA-transferase CaiB-like acyl-CoA transferase
LSFSKLRILVISSRPAALFCSRQFAQWGSDVIVFCDPQDQLEPVTREYLLLGSNLSSDISDIAAVAAQADVLITDADSDWLTEKRILPGDNTILVHITPFGLTGPMADLPGPGLIIEAMSGYLSINGHPAREPLRAPAHLLDYYCGVSTYLASLAALCKRQSSGIVEAVEVSCLDSVTAMVPFLRSQYVRRADERHGGPQTGVRLFPFGDTYLSTALIGKRTFRDLMARVGIGEEAIPDHLDTPEKRYDEGALAAFLKEHGTSRNAESLFNEILSEGGQPIGLYLEPKNILQDRHLESIGFFTDVEIPSLGRISLPGPPATFTRLAFKSTKGRALIAKETGWQETQVPIPAATHATDSKPLAGIRIIDFTQAWIGPFASMMLADLGAEVIKVESHRRVDVWRNWPGNIASIDARNPNAHPYNTSGNFNSANRNKREIALDLTSEEGLDIARAMIRTSDVVLDNYTPRVMKKFGLDYQSLKKIKADIICVSWSGYGKQGPYAAYKANGTTIEAIAGWDSLFGYTDDEPMVMGFYQADAITGMQMAANTLIAVLHRKLTGEGQAVEGSMLEAALGYAGEELIRASLGDDFTRMGNRHINMAPHGVFPCKGEDQWVAIAIETDEQWHSLRQCMKLTISGCDTRVGRLECQDQLEARIADWTSQRERGGVAETLQSAGIPAAEVLDVLEILQHPQFTSRQWFQKQDHADMGEHYYGGFPWRFKYCQLEAHLPPPRLGEHTREVLREILGYEDTAIDQLFAADVIGCVLDKNQI